MKHVLIITLISSATLLFGCASNEKLSGSSYAPGARGEITAKKGDGDNTDLTIEAEHLAPAQNVSSGATNYIVWVQPVGSNLFQNVGALTVNDDLEAKYKTTVPYKEFRVMVTPEPSRTLTSPSGPAIFDQRITR